MSSTKSIDDLLHVGSNLFFEISSGMIQKDTDSFMVDIKHIKILNADLDEPNKLPLGAPTFVIYPKNK